MPRKGIFMVLTTTGVNPIESRLEIDESNKRGGRWDCALSLSLSRSPMGRQETRI